MKAHESDRGRTEIPTDAEIRERIDGAFCFIDQVLDDPSFRERLPKRAQVIVSQSQGGIDASRSRIRMGNRFRFPRGASVVMYRPSEKTAYLLNATQPRLKATRIRSASSNAD